MEKKSFRSCMMACRMRVGVGLVMLLVLLGLVSCRPDTVCRQELEACMGVTVLRQDTDAQGREVWVDTWDSVWVQGVGVDSVLYDNSKNIKELWLPLRGDTSLTRYAIGWHGRMDTLTIRHANTRQFISPACGCAIWHTIDTLWSVGGVVDSLELRNSAVESMKQENVHLVLVRDRE